MIIQPKSHRRLTCRGSALISVLVTMSFVMVMGAAVLSMTLSGLTMSSRTKRSVAAFNLAESAMDLGVRWLKDQASPPSGTSNILPFGSYQNLGGGQYKVTIIPDAGNPGAPLKKYKVVGEGVFGGRTEQVEAVVKQQSFGRYAYFTDSETSSISGGRIWFYAGDRIRGPAHSNNKGGSDFQINWTGSSSPIFDDMVTAAGPSINFSPTPNGESQYQQIFKNGSQGYQTQVDAIDMPSSSDIQKIAAWGSASGFPTTNGVYTPASGGIYIRGDSTVTLSVNASGQQVFTIVQGSTTTAITMDSANNRRRVSVNGGAQTNVAGIGSGVIYTTGSITALSGTIADNVTSGGNITYASSYTIATDVNAGKDIVINNNLKYKSAPDPNQPTTSATNIKPGTLGLMARNVQVDTGAPTSLEIDAVIMAGSSSTSDGSFYVEDYNTKSPTGTLKVVGGILQKARGPVGTLNSAGALKTGYAKDYWYDPRLADNPPPYFPTTGSYDRTSWRRL